MKKLSELRQIEAVNVIDGLSGRKGILLKDLKAWARQYIKENEKWINGDVLPYLVQDGESIESAIKIRDNANVRMKAVNDFLKEEFLEEEV